MHNKRKINYISHTHWDREWYRSSSEFKVRLFATVKKVIETLEADSEFQCFTFDGQYQMIEEVLEIDSSLEQRLKNLTEAGRVLIGPWYIQPDMNLVDGESIANNLRIGIQTTVAKFGTAMNVLWNPDTFFQSGNTPFFVDQFDLNGVYAWRNFAQDNLNDYTFKWKGFDGTEVNAIMFPIGYGYFRYLSHDPKKALSSQIEFINQIDKAFPNSKNDMYLMGGSDHATIQTDTPSLLTAINEQTKDYQFVQSTPEKYMAEADFSNVETFTNQPISYKGGRIHPGIGGSRMDIKQANLEQQTLIAKVLSPIVAITASVGGDDNYKVIDNIWKNLLKNQFHDSIYTSSPEKVNNEIYFRYQLNQQMIDELMYLCGRYIVKNNIDHNTAIDEYIVVFNTLPTSRIATVNAKVKSKHQFIKVTQDGNNIDYTYNDNEVDYESKDYSGLKSLAGKYQIDHNSGVEFGEKYQHTINLIDVELEPMSYALLKVEEAVEYKQPMLTTSNQILDVIDGKLLVNQVVDFIKLENILDNGDSYNFSTNEGQHSEELNLAWSLVEGKAIASFKTENQIVELRAYEEDDKLVVDVHLENAKEDNTCSLVFDFNNEISTKTNLHYAHVTNDSYQAFKDLDWKQAELKEKPLPIYLCSRYVEVNEQATIISNDVTQYYQNDQQVKFTLLRSYGRMGELDLPYRPGRASGYVLDTPSSQQKKSFDYKFVIEFNSLSAKTVNQALVQPVAKFIVPTINESTKQIKAVTSLVAIDNDNVLFETFKVLEDGKYLLRCSNPTSQPQAVNIAGAKRIYNSSLLETVGAPVDNNLFTVQSNNATTVIIEF